MIETIIITLAVLAAIVGIGFVGAFIAVMILFGSNWR